MKKLKILFLSLVLTLGLAGTMRITQAQQEETLETVYDVIQADERLTSFTALVDAAALADNLDHDGPFTVFAPTDTAFATFEANDVDTDATLTEILLYHVINGDYSAPNVANQDSLPTLLGEHVAFDVEDGVIVLNDTVKVTVTDMEASNGVVHIIDAVLLPPTNSLVTSPLGSPDMTIAEVLADDGNFETFLTLAEQAGLTSLLEETSGKYTVFAPTDAAFGNVDEVLLEEWLSDNDALETILLYHIVGDQLSINQLANDSFVPTLEGRAILMTTDESVQVYANGTPIQDFNIQASNGVIHTINDVLTP